MFYNICKIIFYIRKKIFKRKIKSTDGLPEIEPPKLYCKIYSKL